MEYEGLTNILFVKDLGFDSTIEQLLESIESTKKRLEEISLSTNLKKNFTIATNNYVIYAVEDIPTELRDKLEDLASIGEPIYALVYIPYLRSLDGEKKLSTLFVEEGYFYPENPAYTKEIEIEIPIE